MKDREIAKRLHGFEAVWARVRAGKEHAEPDNGRAVPLMPRRRSAPCRRRCR